MIPYWRLSAYYFFYFAFIGTFSPYFGLYLGALELRAWEIGVLMSLMQVMRLIAPNLWGWLADRLGARVPIVRAAAVASLLGYAGLFWSHDFAGLFVGMAVMAFFWTASLPLIETLTLAHLGRQASRYGSIRLWGSVGFVLAVLGVGVALDQAAVSMVLPIGCALLAGIVLSACFIPEAAPEPFEHDVAPLAQILARPDVRSFLAASFFMSAAHGALYVFYSIYLVGAGWSKTVVGGLWTLGVLAEIVVFMFMPQLFRRYPVRSILLFSFGCAVLRFSLIGWGVGSLAVLVIAQLMHGATFGAHHASAMHRVAAWFGPQHQARGQALYGSISFGAGGMMGGSLSGWLWDAAGPALTFSLASVWAALGGWLIWRMREE